MKPTYCCVTAALAVVAMQLSFASPGKAQTYKDILRQVSTPEVGNIAPGGYGTANYGGVTPNVQPTLNSVFQTQGNSTAPRVPSAVVNGGHSQQSAIPYNGSGSRNVVVPGGAMAPGYGGAYQGAVMNGGAFPGGAFPGGVHPGGAYPAGAVHGGGAMGGVLNSNVHPNGISNNGMTYGGVAGGQVMQNGAVNYGQMVNGVAGQNQMSGETAPRGVGQGNPSAVAGSTAIPSGNCAVGFSGGIQPQNIYAPTYGAPVYVPGQSFGLGHAVVPAPVAAPMVAAAPVATSFVAAPAVQCADFAPARTRNFVYGLNGLIFDRDYEDDVYLVRNPAGENLLSTDADVGNFGGLEFFLGTRNCNGNGIDLRYWGLFTDEVSYSLAGASFNTYLFDLTNVQWPSNGRTVYDVMNGATEHTITRDNEIHNVEFNMLRNGGCYTTRGGRCASYELLGGFRWFEFDEIFHWDLTSPTAPLALFFDHEVQNTLLGFQLGGRSEICMTNRLRLNVGTKFGIFNNRSRVQQVLTDDMGTFAVVDGVDYNFRDSKNDLSLLGELNIGTAYNFNPCSRLNIGYRAIGVSGIALAPNQLTNFNFAPAVRSIQSNADLILHGAVFGLEFCR